MPDFLIVTGPGRSGTSAVARVLHESGVSMGEAFGPASRHNPLGFYEESAVVELNERILDDCGMTGMRRWPSREEVLEVASRYAPRMRALVSNATVRGWKDPRFCVTLEAWLPHFASPPKVIVCLRSSEAFVRSSINVFGLIPRELLDRWWEEHLLRALDTIRRHQLDATCVVYDELLRRPLDMLRSLSWFVGQPLDARYLAPGLRHHEHPVPAHHRPLYNEVRSLAYGWVGSGSKVKARGIMCSP